MARKTNDVAFSVLLSDHIDGQPPGTQARLATTLQVSQATITRWRKGEQIPEERRAAEIATATGLRPDRVLQSITDSRIARQKQTEPVPSLADRLSALEAAIVRLTERFDQLGIGPDGDPDAG